MRHYERVYPNVLSHDICSALLLEGQLPIPEHHYKYIEPKCTSKTASANSLGLEGVRGNFLYIADLV